MSQQAFIRHISYYLPSASLTNEELNRQFPEWSVDKISSKTGIENRHVSEAGEFASDMAVKAAQNLFSEHGVSPTDIDFVMLCTQSPDYFLPTTACLVQDRLGIPTSAGAFDFNLGCSGYIYGLGIAKGLIAAGIAKNILFLTSETYTKFIHPADKSNRTIFGDGASATLVSAESGYASIGDFELGTDGSGAENLIVRRGGVRYPSTDTTDAQLDEYGNAHNDNYLYMNGSEIFNFTSTAVPTLVEATIGKNGITALQVDMYIFHQANKFMLNHLRKKLKIPEEKFYLFLKDCGNTVSSTIPIALQQAMAEHTVKPDDTVLLAGFGVGYSWGSTILKIT